MPEEFSPTQLRIRAAELAVEFHKEEAAVADRREIVQTALDIYTFLMLGIVPDSSIQRVGQEDDGNPD